MKLLFWITLLTFTVLETGWCLRELRPTRRYYEVRRDASRTPTGLAGSAGSVTTDSPKAETSGEYPHSPGVCDARLHLALDALEDVFYNCLPNQVSLSDCCQLKFLFAEISGVYRIHDQLTYCDMETDGGGWLVIQRRLGREIGRNFARSWKQYERGFGVLDRDFWLGLQRMHQLTTAADMELRVNLGFPNGTQLFAHYDSFHVAGAEDKYRLSVGGYRSDSTLADALNHHNGAFFSTIDVDNDGVDTLPSSVFNCSSVSGGRGGWWFNQCLDANLNGGIATHGLSKIVWRQGIFLESFAASEMKIRPKWWYCGTFQSEPVENMFLAREKEL